MALRTCVLTLLVAAAAARSAGAQVGYDPKRSPYRDIAETQEVTFFTGYYKAKADPGGVAPQSGAIVGTHYGWRAGGPAHLTFDFARVSSQRAVLDPERSACPTGTAGNCKVVGTFHWPVYLIDAGLAMSLTGARSFFRIVPEIKAGAGLASNFHTESDVGDFAFGTRFAFSWGAGIRWVPGGRYQLRADFTNHLYSVRYPVSYYEPAPDKSTIFTQQQSRSAWLNNPSITIGLSYLFSR